MNGGDVVIFRFYSYSSGTWYGSATVQVGSGTETNVPGNMSGPSSSRLTFSFTNAYTVNTGSESISINSLRKHQSNHSTGNSDFRASVTTSIKTLNKSVIKLRHADDPTYDVFTANANDIYYPSNADGNMYSAYVDVTEYVKQYKDGEYFVADIATSEGDGGGTGFYGGWGMIVVYENSKMKWRDIAIFDGHAYIYDEKGGTNNEANMTYYELPISGFNTAQHGDIRIKYGLIAGEGDRNLNASGTLDRFAIINKNNQWVNLSHANNSTSNYFNSSIYTGGNPRTPSLLNNTGMDIVMDEIPNTNNSIIGNSDTSTKFRYGTNQDTYIIFNIAFAVDAYIPDVESYNQVQQINRNGTDIDMSNFMDVVQPGDVVEFKLEIKNKGTEAVKDLKVEIPIPFSGSFHEAVATYNGHYYGTAQNSIQPVHDGGSPGTLVWEIGDLPLPADGNSDDVLATMTYKIIITTDCSILANSACNSFVLDGSTSGEGLTSGTKFKLNRFITGYQDESTLCGGEPFYAPINLDIDAEEFNLANCNQDPDFYKRSFEFCDIDEIPLTGVDGIRPQFPVGTRFYSAIETYYLDADGNEAETGDADFPFVRKAADAIEYGTTTTPFPLGVDDGPQTYYALAPGLYVTCYWEFTITVNEHCGNFWVGTEDNLWSNSNNWTINIPATHDPVVFATNANNKNKPALKDLHVDGDYIIGDLENDSDKNLIVKTGKSLTIEGTVIDTNSSAGTIIVEAKDDEATGTLLFTNAAANSNVDATVQFYNKAFTCDDCGTTLRQQWQYFGIPVQTTNLPFGPNLNIKRWDEPAFGDKWTALSSGAALSAFGGYEVNDNSTTLPHVIYNFTGALNIGNANVPLTYSSNVNYTGWNLIGNSFTAAIPISAEAISYSDDSNWEKSVYLFNTGSRHVWRKMSGNQVDGVESGRYTVVPVQLGGQASLPNQIPSMHAFMVLVKGGTGGTLTLDYSELEKNVADAANNQPAWRSTSSGQRELPYIVLDVMGEGSADRVWLFENSSATRGYDSGWDGHKIVESDLIQVYATDADHNKLQVSTVPQFDDVNIGIAAREGENYTITVATHGDVDARRLYLHDTFTGKGYLLRNGTEIVVAGTRSTNQNRFKITASDLPAKMIEESAINTYVRNGMIVVENRSGDHATVSVYDIAGRFVGKANIAKDEMKSFPELSMAKGVLVVKVQSDNGGVARSDRVMLK